MSAAAMKGLVEALLHRVLEVKSSPGRVCACPATVELKEFSSRPWASATFEGHRHQFTLRIAGTEQAVDLMASQLEQDFARDEHWGHALIVADICRLQTDKAVDGAGGAISCLAFEALTILP